GPDELRGIVTRLVDDGRIGGSDARLDLRRRELVNGITRNDRASAAGAFGVETRRATATVENGQTKVAIRQREHRTVFIERSAPRHHRVEREHVIAIPAAAPDSFSTSCRSPAG